MEKQLRKVEELIEQSLDRVTCHPAFLQTISNLINWNSQRKIWTRSTLESVWKRLELPIKSDQERILLALQELQIRERQLRLELHAKEAEIHRVKILRQEKRKPLRRAEGGAKTLVTLEARKPL